MDINNMTYTDKRLEEYCKKFGLCKEKGTCQCKKELKFISEAIAQAIAEEREKMRGEIEFVKTNIAWHRTQGIEADSGDDARQIGWDGACDLILSTLDNLPDKDI